MSEGYYSGGFRKKRRKKRMPLARRLLTACDLAVGVAAIAGSAVSLLCITVPAFRPNEEMIWSAIPLLYPIVYMTLFLAVLYYISRWKIRAAGTVLVFLLAASVPLSRYYSLPTKKQYPQENSPRSTVGIVTYNVANRYASPIVDYVTESKAQILCLQELIFGADSHWDSLSETYPYSTLHEKTRYANAIYSKYRMIRDGTIDSLSRFKAVWADLDIKGDTVRVLNLHLQHTAIGKADERAIQEMNSEQGDSIIRSVTGRISLNNSIRAGEAEAVRRFIDASPHRTIVCGDFNDVPLSYTYRTISRGLADAFREKGKGYSYTYAGFWNTLRIDYILLDRSMTVVEYNVDNETDFSDHYAVKVKFKL